MPYQPNSTTYLSMILKGLGIALLGFAVTACGGGGQKADPTLQSMPVAYVKRPVPTNNNGNPISGNLFTPAAFNLGAELIIKSAAAPSAPETRITPALLSDPALRTRTWDVKDLEFSIDGTKLIFAARLQVNPNDNTDVQTWDIYEYNLSTAVLRRVMASDLVALLGDEVTPNYLLDGRIIYSSTMNWTTRDVISGQGSAAISPAPETEGNNGGPAFSLHVMRVDGSEITQVSFGTSHDLYPSLMHTGPFNGRIVFSRWDTKASGPNPRDRGMHLYMMDPDGRGGEYLYGRNSHATGTTNDAIQFAKPRQMPDGRILSLIRRTTGTFDGGAVTLINVQNFVDNTLPIGSQSGSAQTDISGTFASTRNGITNTGKYNAVYPLLDGTNRALVSYSECFVNVVEDTITVTHRCTDSNLVNPTVAPPRYGVFMYDMSNNTRTVVTAPVEGFYFTDVSVAQERPTPTFMSMSTDSSLAGIIHFRNIKPAGNTAVSARFYKHVYLPDEIHPNTVGADGSRSLRELIGYAPIAADGSVRVRLPANVPLSMQLVNANNEDIGPEHEAWFSVRSGEEKTCNGCHVTGQPHGRRDAETVANAGGTIAPTGTGTNINPLIDYPSLDPTVLGSLVNNSGCPTQANWIGNCRVTIDYNTHIHPIWAANGCVACHDPNLDLNADMIPDGLAGVGGLDLTIAGADAGEPTNYNAYTNLAPSRIDPGSASSSVFFAGGRFDVGGTHAGRLNAGQIKMIREWVDMGAQYSNRPLPP